MSNLMFLNDTDPGMISMNHELLPCDDEEWSTLHVAKVMLMYHLENHAHEPLILHTTPDHVSLSLNRLEGLAKCHLFCK